MKENHIPPHLRMANYKEQKRNSDKESDKSLIKLQGYVRISTKKEAQKTSLEFQEKLLKEWCEVHGYQYAGTVFDIKSGAYMNSRTGIQDLLEMAKNEEIHGLITKEVSRTSRDIQDIIQLKRKLSDYGAFLISIKEGYDSRSDNDEFLLTIYAAIAQKERTTIGSRLKTTQLIKARNGRPNNRPAFGYRISEDKTRYEPCPIHTPIYKEIVDMFLSGKGKNAICRELNGRGLKTYLGSKFSSLTIDTILRNPVYIGTYMYNTSYCFRDAEGKKQRVIRPQNEWIVRENNHESLIENLTWESIQESLDKRKIDKKYTVDKKYLLTGNLICSRCGSKIYGKIHSRTRKDGSRPVYYLCYNEFGNCHLPYTRKEIIEDMVKEHLTKIIYDPEILRDEINNQKNIMDVNNSDLVQRREIIQKELSDIEKAMNKQFVAYEKDIIDVDTYGKRIKELKQNKLILEEELSVLEKKLRKTDRMDNKTEILFREIKQLLDLEKNPDVAELALGLFVDKIYVDYKKDKLILKYKYTFQE